MRELKFRVWNYEEIIYPNVEENDLFLLIGDCGYFSVEDHSNENFDKNKSINGHKDLSIMNSLDENLILMQYTGLKDKNENEIYEGDIVTDDSTIFEIKWYKGGFDFNRLSGCYQSPYFGDNCSRMEIIGNIYENKELLK